MHAPTPPVGVGGPTSVRPVVHYHGVAAIRQLGDICVERTITYHRVELFKGSAPSKILCANVSLTKKESG
jgi:hypothetical protein